MPRIHPTPACWLPLLAAAALAQSAPPAAIDKPATVSGTVTNSLTGEPVLRAHVTLTGRGTGPSRTQETYGSLTNGEGKFSMTSLPPGDYTVSLERVGFVFLAPMNSAASRATSFSLGPGDRRDDFKLTLTPTGAIIGHVLDAAGEPVQNATVAALGGNGQSNTTTDDKGQFRLGGLRPGKYRVKATPQALPFPPEIRSDGAPDIHYSPTYYGDALTAKAAQRLEVKSGADMGGTDIHLVRTPLVTVSGKVAGIPAGVKNVFVQVMTPEGNSVGSWANVKPDGSFEIWRLDPGKYILLAAGMGQSMQNRLQSGPLEIEVADANLDHLELRMIPAFEVAAQLHFEDEQARQLQWPTAPHGQTPPPPPPRRVQLRADPPGQYLNADVAADDSLTLENLQPGRYHVSLTWSPAFVKSVRAGSTETEGDILDVRNGPPGPVTVLVSSNFCEVSGTVTDSKGPVPGGSVVLVTAEAAPSFHAVPTDSNGAYKLTHIPPGKYRLAAVDDPSVAMANRGAGMDDYEDVTETLELRAGDKVTKDLHPRQ